MQFIKPNWNAPKQIKAITSTRLGGVSLPPYDSLNLGDHVGDASDQVTENRRLLSEAIQNEFINVLNANNGVAPQFNWLRQEHTTKILHDSDDQQQLQKQRQKQPFDGHFTREEGVICTIMTADCLPVFICDQKGTEVALVHAGWRGLASGIVEKALELFSAPKVELLVHCGPGISKQYFEIGDEVRQLLGGSDQFYQSQVHKVGHFLADLSGLLGERMAEKGVKYTQSSHCTFAESDKFFSFRRDGVTGRMVSLLWIEPNKKI